MESYCAAILESYCSLHFGVSGPVILSASGYLEKEKYDNLYMVIDLKPGLTEEQLDKRLLRDFAEYKNKDFRNSLDKLLPKTIIPVIIKKAGINPEKKVNEITKEERQKFNWSDKKIYF